MDDNERQKRRDNRDQQKAEDRRQKEEGEFGDLRRAAKPKEKETNQAKRQRLLGTNVSKSAQMSDLKKKGINPLTRRDYFAAKLRGELPGELAEKSSVAKGARYIFILFLLFYFYTRGILTPA